VAGGAVGEVGEVVLQLVGLGTDARRAVLLAVDRVHRAHLCGGGGGRGRRSVPRSADVQVVWCWRRGGVKPHTSSNLRSNILVTPFLHTSCTRR
jgi:hypothetical protein